MGIGHVVYFLPCLRLLRPVIGLLSKQTMLYSFKNRAKRKEDRKRMSYLFFPIFRELLVYVEPFLNCWVYKPNCTSTSTLTNLQIYTHLRDSIFSQESILRN